MWENYNDENRNNYLQLKCDGTWKNNQKTADNCKFLSDPYNPGLEKMLRNNLTQVNRLRREHEDVLLLKTVSLDNAIQDFSLA